MIKKAHVGIGVFGNEGSQAALNSDFAIGRFHFLRRLLFVHGHWNYSRYARMALLIFYKQIVRTTTTCSCSSSFHFDCE